MSTKTDTAPGAGRTIDLVAALRRQWFIPVVCAILAAALGFAYTRAIDREYESTATVLLLRMHNESAPGGGRDRTLDVETQATLARSSDLLTSVGERLSLDLPTTRQRSTAVAAPTGDVLLLTFSDKSQTRAAEGATVYAQQFLALRKSVANADLERQQTSLQAQITQLSDQVADLTQRLGASEDLDERATLQDAITIANQKLADVRASLANLDTDEEPGRVVVDPATAVKQSGLPTNEVVGGAFAAGLVLGLLLALIRDRKDDRYGSALDLEQVGIDEVGRVPYVADVTSPAYAQDRATRQSYSRLLMRACFTPDGATEGGGTSTCVVAVDSATLPADTAARVVDALSAEGEHNAVRLAVPVFSPRVDGQDGRSFWDGVPRTIEGIARQHDAVLVSAPPLDSSATGIPLAAATSRALLVVSARTKVRSIIDALDDLHAVGQDEVEVVVVSNAPRGAGRRS